MVSMVTRASGARIVNPLKNFPIGKLDNTTSRINYQNQLIFLFRRWNFIFAIFLRRSFRTHTSQPNGTSPSADTNASIQFSIEN